uniref:Uncharacterized protein n=1 Tax=Cnaphalocrocis medinalis granulovirus TaxID=1750712 RepID=A0A109P386_9BBAC|nr:hypothetical protein [Cnaphalocrocis medinalis granulovirus]
MLILDPNVERVTQLLNTIPDNALYHAPSKAIMLKSLKNLWCSRGSHNYKFLQHFINQLQPNELNDFTQQVFVKKLMTIAILMKCITTKTTTSDVVVVTKKRLDDSFWIVDNTNVYKEHRSRVPFDEITISLLNIHDIIDAFGMYCVASTCDLMKRISVEVFHENCVSDETSFKSVVTSVVRRRYKSLFSLPPLRDDICYRFTKNCQTLVQQIRNVV